MQCLGGSIFFERYLLNLNLWGIYWYLCNLSRNIIEWGVLGEYFFFFFTALKTEKLAESLDYSLCFQLYLEAAQSDMGDTSDNCQFSELNLCWSFSFTLKRTGEICSHTIISSSGDVWRYLPNPWILYVSNTLFWSTGLGRKLDRTAGLGDNNFGIVFYIFCHVQTMGENFFIVLPSVMWNGHGCH